MSDQDDLFPIEVGIPWGYQGPRARLSTVRRAIRRTEQECVSILDSWSLRSYDDYEWLEVQISRERIGRIAEEEKAGERLSFLRALEFGLRVRNRDGQRR